MDLQTDYLGIRLKNPLVVSSCPLSENIETIKAMEQAGAAAIVMYSIFEEEIRCDDEFIDFYLHYGTNKFAEALTYFPNIDQPGSLLTKHLSHLRQAVAAVNIPIIGSLNAITISGWMDYALQMQDTGIQALELNLYRPSTSVQAAVDIENNYLNIVRELKSKLRIPLAVKLSPFFTSISDIALKLANVACAEGLVIFNRFYYPDFNVDHLEFEPSIQLSNPYEARLPLKWISTLYNKLPISIAASTGVDNSNDIVKYILAGANVVMCASCLMRHGVSYLGDLLADLEKWLKNKNYSSVKEIHGLMSREKMANSEELDRAQYMKALRGFKTGEHFD
jgi:dihydroorotate dehydrogenase (fumarate)